MRLGFYFIGSQLFWLFLVTASAASNFEIELNRRMINHMTKYLTAEHANLEGVLLDLNGDKLVVTTIFQSSNFRMLEWIKPTLRPGEIFLPASQRSGQVTIKDEKDFVVAIQLELSLQVKSSDIDTVYLSFIQPKVAAYYKEDLREFKLKQRQLLKLLSEYDSANTELDRINMRLKRTSENDLKNQLALTTRKLKLRKIVNEMAGTLDVLNREVIRFSGSYLSVLPSDKLLQDLVQSIGGQISGDSILEEAFRRVEQMKVMHQDLSIKLVGNIVNRSGTIRVGNIGKSLIGIVPGFRIRQLSVHNRTLEAHNASGLKTDNFVLRLEADIVRLRGDQ